MLRVQCLFVFVTIFFLFAIITIIVVKAKDEIEECMIKMNPNYSMKGKKRKPKKLFSLYYGDAAVEVIYMFMFYIYKNIMLISVSIIYISINNFRY